MKKLDSDGLWLCNYQGKIFELSATLCECSSPIFIRRFRHCSYRFKIDKNDVALIDLMPDEVIENINEEFGKSSYGQIKYDTEILYWMGYLYRYICYTREIGTAAVMKRFNYKDIKNMYYAYHTQDMEYVVESLLELNHLTEDTFDKMAQIKDYYRPIYEKLSGNTKEEIETDKS